MPDRYDFQQTWLWNLQNPPLAESTDGVQIPDMPGDWMFQGLPTNSCLGIPAGPLLNSGWLLHYARLGYDVLTYKTVRTTARPCYPVPNLSPVKVNSLHDGNQTVATESEMAGSWAVSFGMPSVAADDWQADVATAKAGLSVGQVLVVSVVGEAKSATGCVATSERERFDQMADDYAACAAMAVASGADVIEANFSCPNVCSADGQLYQHPQQAAIVSSRIRQAIGNVPLLVKIGLVETSVQAKELLHAIAEHVQGLCMTNAISAKVQDEKGGMLFHSEARGICGKAIHYASVKQVDMFQRVIQQDGLAMEIAAVGGVFEAQDVRRFLNAGARNVGMATSAMCDPMTAISIRKQWVD